MIDSKFKVFVDAGNSNRMTVNDKRIPPKTAAKIAAFHRRARRYITGTAVSFYANTMFCFALVVIWINGVYQVSLLSLLFWFVFFPLLFFYFVNINSWRRFLALNGQVAAICRQITGLATFWKTFLTMIFAQYIVYQVYMAYIAFYSTSMTIYIRLFFFVTVLEINGLLFWLIANCASVLTANGRFEKANRSFAFSLFTSSLTQRETSSFKVSGVRLVQLIKAETLQCHRSLSVYSFVLFDNYRIRSHTYYLIISYVSVFFMSLFKRERAN
ncbi:hypothetical protein TYRP_014858 [Tyrophagus putrescentiae]|nr:hypothetical protein TYRP_014858 [Tyrophagus putrescentiae]